MGLSPNSPIRLRKEVRDYLSSCEKLLSSAISSDNTPLSDAELDLVEFYQGELKKHLLTTQTR